MKNIFKDRILNILIFLLIIILPLQTRYFLYVGKINNIFFEYGSLAIYLSDIYVVFLIIYLLIYNFKNKLFKFNNKTKTISFLLIIFNIFLNLSLINSINKNISIYFNIRFFIFSIFIFLLLFPKIDKKYFKDGFIYSGVIQGIMAIYQFANQKIIANKFLGLSDHFPYDLGTSVVENYSGRFLRSYGLLPHPNILGIFLVTSFAFLFFEILKNRKKNYINYFLLGIIFIGIILTFSRAAFIILIVFILITLFYIIKNKVKINVEKIVIIFLILFTNIFIFKSLIFTRISDNRLNNISNIERENQYFESTDIVRNNFLFGVGERNYTTYISRVDNIKNVYDLKPVHNIYILILSELGIFGFVTFIILITVPLFIKYDIEIMIVYFLILLSGLFDHFLITESFGLYVIMLFLCILFNKKDTIKSNV